MYADYKDTLNLPSTDFPMRANLTVREPEIKAKWDALGLYHKMMEKREGRELFILHDGPPYANGDMHMGHALNKSIKDFIIKSRNMGGYKAPYIHGWDTNGLPVENQMIKKFGSKIKEMPVIEFRRKCREFALSNVERQKAQQQSLGVIGDWDRSYLTLAPEFSAKQIKIFGDMAKKGYMYKGLRPVYWCAHDETALAEAEIEYADDECDSIYVKFKVTDDKGLFGNGETYFVIWTTTAWTLPGNVAICLNADFEYGLYRQGGKYLVMAKTLAENVVKQTEGIDPEPVRLFKGSELEFIKTRHPFIDRDSLVILGSHVTAESGTGCVHTAPGHGMDDFEVCKNYPSLPVIVPVDGKGRMTVQAEGLEGMKTAEANEAIIKILAENESLLATEKIVHQYPHCWRCKNPILFRATEQWFCDLDKFKKETLEAVKNVRWIPAWGEARMENMVKDRANWCISRQRRWGVPIPAFYCVSCGKIIINDKTINKISQLFAKEGADAWYEYTPAEILGDDCVCTECGCGELKAETDILDVWFDSGSSYAYVLEGYPEQRFPADVYLEGNDQYRGWFQSSLLTSVATRGIAPYKTCITHGMIIDEEKRKMSKSLGNGIEPKDIIGVYGADVLRLWVSSVEYTVDVRLSNEILKQLSEMYRKIRNTLRILLANLGSPENDFDPNRHMIAPRDMLDIDKWAVAKLNGLTGRVRKAYDSYQFHLIYHDIHNYCSIDLSKLYIDITKDRLYCQRGDDFSRRSAQSAMYMIAHSLIRLLAPILSFTMEESWGYICHLENDDGESVFFNEMPEFDAGLCFEKAENDFDRLFGYRDAVMKALEIARNDKIIGKSLEARVTVYGKKEDDFMRLFEERRELLETIFIVSGVELSYDKPGEGAFTDAESGISALVGQADGEKCVRCWLYTRETVKDEAGRCLCKRCADAV